MPIVNVEDIAIDIGRPISDADEIGQVEQRIADVETILSARLGDLADLNQPLLGYVERTVVIEWMRHRAESSDETPGEYKSMLLALDPWWSILASAGAAGETPTAWSFSLLGSY